MATATISYKRSEAKEWAREALRDYYVCTTMPYNADLSIDLDGLRRNVEHLLTYDRLGGVFVNSMYQEPESLTLAERKRVTECVISTVDGRVPVMVGVSANPVADVVELANHSHEHGASLVFIDPPINGTPTAEGVINFYHQVARQIEIGFAVWATTSLHDVGYQLTADHLEELAKIENFCAAKVVSFYLPTYYDIMERLGEKLVISFPHEEYYYWGRMVGGPARAAQVMLGTSRPLYIQGKQVRLADDFLDAMDAEDFGAATEILRRISRITHGVVGKAVENGGHGLPMTKAVTELFGMAGGPVRPPFGAPDPRAVATAEALLKAEGIL
jgi:4-hydroxy-tetrahydrodipicolinate synthase